MSSDVYKTLYQNVFRSNIAYLTYVFAGAIVLEFVYSKGIDTMWEINNRGVSLLHIMVCMYVCYETGLT